MKEFFSLEGQGVAEQVELRMGQEPLSATEPLPGASGSTSSAWPPVPPLLLTGCQTWGKITSVSLSSLVNTGLGLGSDLVLFFFFFGYPSTASPFHGPSLIQS